MKQPKNILLLILLLFSFGLKAEVPEFEATTGKDGKIFFDDTFDPPAGCVYCKAMKAARKSIKPNPKDTAQQDKVTAAHDVMLNALLNFKKVKAITAEDALMDYNLQLILLFDRLDRADDSPTAVERMAAYVENPESKKSYREALSKIPEAIRNRVIKRIDEFNQAQEKELQQEKRKPSSAKAPGVQ